MKVPQPLPCHPALQYCDRGSLGDAVKRDGLFHCRMPSGVLGVDLIAVLDVSLWGLAARVRSHAAAQCMWHASRCMVACRAACMAPVHAPLLAAGAPLTCFQRATWTGAAGHCDQPAVHAQPAPAARRRQAGAARACMIQPTAAWCATQHPQRIESSASLGPRTPTCRWPTPCSLRTT